MDEPASPRAAVVVRSAADPVASYQDYRPLLRRDFWYSCAYCTLSEVEASAVGFQIDHYLPQASRPELERDYGNLYWSCQPCNRHKGAFAPTPEQVAAGQAIIRADTEHPREHLADAADDTGAWVGLTPKGEFNIFWLDLNRPGLKRLRRARRDLAESSIEITFGVADILARGVDAVRREHKGYLAKLHRDAKVLERQWEQGVEAFIRECLSSPLLEDAPRKRLRHLQDERALVPGAERPTPSPQRRPRKAKRRRRRWG